MISSSQLQLLRNADPGAVLPGIDTPTGNLDPASSLTNYTTLTTSSSAPYHYNPSEGYVVVTQAGAVLSGINFGGATLYIDANNVTVKDCSFTPSASSGYYSVQQGANVSGAVVENCTFTGPTYSTRLNAFVTSETAMTLEDNSFLNSGNHAINIDAGVVTGNYFCGEGFNVGAHADAIDVEATTGPVSITNNFIDWTPTPGAAVGPNEAIRISPGAGPVSNVTVSGNYVIGGNFTVLAPGGAGYSNVSVKNNYIGFGYTGAFYPGTGQGVTQSGNVIFDYTNPMYSTQAWAAYKAAGIPTVNLVTSTGANILSNSTSSTTLYGAGVASYMYSDYYGVLGETSFVGGAGRQYMVLGAGANIITELAITDSTPSRPDDVNAFDPAKDVIDLSHIDADPGASGVQNFTFIGTAPFSGGGAQVRYQQNPTSGVTYVEADVAGDSSPDLTIELGGLLTLTASNFALTAAQSTADLAAGAALSATKIHAASGSAYAYSYTNVQGRNYTSYEAIPSEAEDFNLSSTSNQLDVYGNNVTIARGSGTETLVAGTSTFALGYHSNETIQIGAGAETLKFGSNFGTETISGFAASGTSADTIQLAKSSFTYLTAGMTQAQDLAAVLSHTTTSSSGITIKDSFGDGLTLAGLTASTINANPSQFKFV